MYVEGCGFGVSRGWLWVGVVGEGVRWGGGGELSTEDEGGGFGGRWGK